MQCGCTKLYQLERGVNNDLCYGVLLSTQEEGEGTGCENGLKLLVLLSQMFSIR